MSTRLPGTEMIKINSESACEGCYTAEGGHKSVIEAVRVLLKAVRVLFEAMSVLFLEAVCVLG
jgi:hypothetical protein